MPKSPDAVLHALWVHPVKSMAGHTPDRAAVEPWGLAGDRRWTLIDGTGKVVTQRQRPRLALIGAELRPDGGVRLSGPGLEPVTVAVPRAEGAAGGAAGGDGAVRTTVADIFGTKVESVPAASGTPDAHRLLSEYLGVEVRLVHLDDPARRRAVDPLYGRPGETVSFADGFPVLVTTLASLDALNSLVRQGDHPEEGPLPMDRFRPNLVVAGTEPWAEDGWRRLAVGEVTFRVAKPCGRCVITTTDQHTAERGREPLRTLGRHRLFDGKLVFGQNLVPERTGVLRVGDPVTVLE
ncbi:MOSC domain-containing protein [Streptomyces corynorhini]|uniref:MOSC domain-containing protein n=1 Tax=Streptomyces corynorhini TaxID=2282652 RepID=A0A370B8F5_9ACTN|nr:MOSC N-terminal beta barrel domain-containing protein [Streptomyces corynorhini]RDG36026.1 MOSC domain-containing protein [Streptomyces corynorhini]